MNAATLAWRAVRHKPLAASLNLLLVAIGIAMMTFILGVSNQLEEHAEREAQGIDLVVGAKGSPLQLILSSVYHADIPTGNIPASALAALAAQPLVQSAIPLALGDNFQGFRIVGSTTALLDHYGADLAQGLLFSQPMQAVFGARAARETGASVGATFAGSHGLAAGGELHDHAPYKVVGILQPTGTVLDRLILTPVASVWQVHETDPDEQPSAAPERELTAVLVQYASPLAAISLPRWVNSQPSLQAAQPAFEAARLFNLLGVGIDVLRAIAAGVLLVAALSLFVALYGALEERRMDMAILRTLGASPAKLLRLLLAQGLLLSLAGTAIGWLLGHAGIALLESMQDLNLQAWRVAPGEAWLPVIAMAVGLLAAALPAMRAYRTDIAAVLARP
ncbi:ABC transporter permease [Janthinobacterium lividum]|uniref:ABC transporter permease n=1 Tax=Janthinobacterium lividum TaxID=29581 RepID=UPI0014080A19|nr:FtsX-like permease family protein [Janthinobacterium lividum]NHQ92345.1 FtsX-like permease family protein [Janthinobacterium lividum]